MAISPVNYGIDVASPIEGYMQGTNFALGQQRQQLQNTGLGIQNDQQALALQQAQQAAQQQDAAKARQQAYVQAIQGLGPAPTNDAYLRLNSQFPEFAEPTQKLASQWGAERTRNETLAGVQYLRVLQSDPNQAAQLAQQRADASKNAGDQQMQQYWQSHADEAKNLSSITDPAQRSAGIDTLRNATMLQIAAVDPTRFKDISTSLKLPGEIAKVGSETQKAGAEIANIQSQITDRAKRFGLDQDKLMSETQIKLQELADKRGELPEYVAKDISGTATEAIAAQQSSRRMNELASQIEQAAGDLGSGVTARAGEAWKRAFGSQNELTRIRSEFSRIVTPAAMAAYKTVASGSTSDKDIETAMIGVPKDTDSPERMASFLRGAAKLQVYDSVLNNAKSEWLAAVRNLGKANKDIEIDGVKVPAGMTFKNFADQYVAKKVNAQTAAAVLPSRGYMKYAEPAPAAPVASSGGVIAGTD